MCGIAGILVVHNPQAGPGIPHHLDAIPEAWLDTLDDSIEHRGPDGEGRFRDRAVRDEGTVVDVAFVHRRLSIIDHEGGHQPMVHDGERLRSDLTYARGETPILAHEVCDAADLVAVVFNGCVYNHRELRAELERLGHRFETDHSDTEVLVHGWRAWERGLPTKLDAMHATLVWDRLTTVLAFGRDPAGEKPLRYARSKGVTVFSSRGAWVPGGESTPGVSPQTMSDVFDGRFGSAFGKRVLDGDRGWRMHPCPALSSGGRAQLRQHTSWPTPPDQRRSGAQSGQGIVALLPAAITSRLEADAPLGLFLSGGIDSALIAAIARQHRPDIRAFTVRMPEARYDESQDAAETAKALDLNHTILDCDAASAGDDLVMLIHQLGLPFGDSSLLPTYWLCKAAGEHVKVALSGDGGDELFGGYRRHTITPMLNRWRNILRLIPHALLDRRTPGSKGEYLARLAIAARHGGYPELTAIFQTPDLVRLLGAEAGDRAFSPVDDPLIHDFKHYLPDDLLRKTDTASMAVPIEVRAPFLARGLVDAALGTPVDVLMPKGQRKGLLKQIARAYLPDHVIDRPKRGFAIPIGEWFRSDFGGLRQLLHDHLRSADPFPGLGEAGVEINMGFVEKMLREHDAAGDTSINPWHGRDHSQRLFMLLVLSIWAKWLEGRAPAG